MKKKNFIIFCFIFILTACTSTHSYEPIFQVEKPYNQKMQSIDENYIHSLQEFAIDFTKIHLDEENHIYSPLSIFNCYAMLYEGSNGNTKKELEETFHLNAQFVLKEAIKNVMLATSIDLKNTKLDTANSLWIDESFQDISLSYVQTLKDYYFAEAYHGNLSSDAIHQVMADWINEKTNHFLKVEKEDFKNVNGILSLINTIYFKDAWVDRFSEYTNIKDIFLTSGQEVTYMQKEQPGRIYQTNQYVIGRLSLENQFAINILLPNENQNLNSLLQDKGTIMDVFNASRLCDQSYLVFYKIPKFQCERQYDLVSNLKALGLQDVFSNKSNLSSICENRSLYVNNSIHSAKIALDNDGIEAAAYTTIGIDESCPEPNLYEKFNFHVNKEFFYVIEDAHHLPLFIGINHSIE